MGTGIFCKRVYPHPLFAKKLSINEKGIFSKNLNAMTIIFGNPCDLVFKQMWLMIYRWLP
jgi:hypothetical protein